MKPTSSTIANASHLIVDDVVVRLTGSGASGPGSSAPLRARLRRAASEFDERAAGVVARALIESLCETPDDLRKLEALILVGLAHPGVLEAERISLATEGRRLAVLLERAGDPERAGCILDLVAENAPDPEPSVAAGAAGAADPEATAEGGSQDDLVEHCLRNADEAAARGAMSEAIAWLRQILRVEPGRRDVVRMIRLLAERDQVRRQSLGRRFKLVLCAGLASVLATSVALRESRIDDAWKNLPRAVPGDLASHQERERAIDALLAGEHVWLGMIRPVLEKPDLRAQITALESQQRASLPPPPEISAPAIPGHDGLAEAARQRGLKLVERGRYSDALADLRRSLEVATPYWEHRARVEADVAALEAWRGKGR